MFSTNPWNSSGSLAPSHSVGSLFGRRDNLSAADEAQSGDLPVGLRDRDRDGEERRADPSRSAEDSVKLEHPPGNSEEGYQLREGNR